MPDSFTSSKFLSIIEEKCPRCQTGKVFKFKPYNLKSFTQMNEQCPVCGLHYEIEPGFFWGAMYVSYAITTGMMLVLGALTYLIGNNPNFWIYMIVICGAVITGSPFVFRYSRILLLYLFSQIRFDKKYFKE